MTALLTMSVEMFNLQPLGGGETKGGTQRTASLLSSLLHQFFQHTGGQFLAYGYIILKVKPLLFSFSE